MAADKRDAGGLYALMERYIDGDKRAFARLHERLQPRLKGLLIKMCGDAEISEDLLQLTMLKAHLARDRFAVPGNDPDGAVLAWYFAIARNAAVDHLRGVYRAQSRHPESSKPTESASELADPEPTLEELAIGEEDRRAIVDVVRAAIDALPATQREVVELHKLRGMSMAQVAERLQIREGAVRVRAHRAYKALARKLGR